MLFQGLKLQQLWTPPCWLQALKGYVKGKIISRWQKLMSGYSYPCKSEHSYWAASTVPAETLWQTVTNLADVAAWPPLITRTNAPQGQRAKPGLIYRAFSRYLPVSTQIFIERVLPGELLSVRVFPLPGLQERATYRIVSTICGTCVFYSVTLSGWQAAERAAEQPKTARHRLYPLASQDIFS